MILRLFLIMLLVNTAAFAVKAKAEEPISLQELEETSVERLQNAMAGDFSPTGRDDALTEIGSRLLSWQFSEDVTEGRRYASDSMEAKHGVALIEEGACLNLKWQF
ncbi:hypothetical protein C8D92_101149 [Tamilnaduibacter salinus]|uniref:Uncharacterized protein n=1 Tax=Tamilnaduibacter salinus TaxID=1484056 RepID=A0A2U1D0M5_9GAMM|nr:hypothetical protein [Tamilnaduibacter salinus]PVY78943.1 hypothetical protein C8D92_101149 [Tamilnaduibacter salinus]